MRFLLAIAPATDSSFGSFLHGLIHIFLPEFTMFAGFMAVIWLACAVITLAGFAIGSLVFFNIRELVRTCMQRMRNQRNAEYARLVTVHPDGITTQVINLDRYRHRHQRPDRDHNNPPTDGDGAPSNNDPS